MTVWFTSDLHLGHKLAASLRGFGSIEEHDRHILEQLVCDEGVQERDKLFVLGDLAFRSKDVWRFFECLPKKVHTTLILGNHDMLPASRYLLAGACNIIGLHKYKKKFWLSHAPIHPQELCGCVNIHGHVHDGGLTQRIPSKDFFCVTTEFWGFRPVPFDEIERRTNEE